MDGDQRAQPEHPEQPVQSAETGQAEQPVQTEQIGPTEQPDPTEQIGPTGQAYPTEPRQRLYREPEDRKLTGLCGGVADYLGTDPTVVRLAVVLLALWNHAAILVYLIGAIVIPERPATMRRTPPARSLVPGRWTLPVIGLLLFAVFAGVTDRRWWFDAPIIGLGLVGVGLWLLVKDRVAPVPATGTATDTDSAPSTARNDIFRENLTAPSAERTTVVGEATPQGDLAGPPASESIPGTAIHKTEDGTPPVPVPPVVTSSVPDSSAVSTGPQGEVPPPVPPWGLGTLTEPHSPPPVPRRSPRTFGLPTALLGIMLLVGGICTLLVVFEVVDVDVGTLFASVLVAVGLGLVIGAWRGRVRGLIGIGLPLVGLLLLSDAADMPLGAGSGDRTEVVDDVAEIDDDYELMAGELLLDLRDLPQRSGEIPTIRAEVGIGNLVVVLPPDVTAEVDALIGVGELSGPGVDGSQETGVHVERDYEIEGREGGGRVRLDVQVGLGELEVRRG